MGPAGANQEPEADRDGGPQRSRPTLRGRVPPSPARCLVSQGSSVVFRRVLGVRLPRGCSFKLLVNWREMFVTRVLKKNAAWTRRSGERVSAESGGVMANYVALESRIISRRDSL